MNTKNIIILIFTLVLFGCNNDTTNSVKKISSEFIGKWEITTFRFTNESSETKHTLPYTVNGINLISGGYEVNETSVKMYANGIILQNLQELYSDGNAIYNSSGQSGVNIQIDGNNAIVTTLTEVDYCKKVFKFSWE
jgi:hypothetical protein